MVNLFHEYLVIVLSQPQTKNNPPLRGSFVSLWRQNLSRGVLTPVYYSSLTLRCPTWNTVCTHTAQPAQPLPQLRSHSVPFRKPPCVCVFGSRVLRYQVVASSVSCLWVNNCVCWWGLCVLCQGGTVVSKGGCPDPSSTAKFTAESAESDVMMFLVVKIIFQCV